MPYKTVFMSHAHSDNEKCDSYAEALQKRGISLYYDRTTPQVGHDLSEALQREIQGAEALIVMVTPASLSSFWVSEEISMFYSMMARDRSRLLIPVMLESCELPPRLAARWWVDASTLPFQKVVDELISALEIDSVPTGSPPRKEAQQQPHGTGATSPNAAAHSLAPLPPDAVLPDPTLQPPTSKRSGQTDPYFSSGSNGLPSTAQHDSASTDASNSSKGTDEVTTSKVSSASLFPPLQIVRRRLRLRNVWIVAAAVLLVVVSAFTLQSQLFAGTSNPGTSNSSPSPTATSRASFFSTQDAERTQTATIYPHLPYRANAPGPKCDTGGLSWYVFNQADLHCFSDHTYVRGSLSDGSCSAACTAGETFFWLGGENAGISLPPYFTVNVTVSGLDSNTTAFIGFETHSISAPTGTSYQFDLNANGAFRMVQCNSPANCLPHWDQGNTLYLGNTRTGTHTISVSLRKEGTVAWGMDGSMLGQTPQTPVEPVDSIYIGIDTSKATPAGQASFANFVCATP